MEIHDNEIVSNYKEIKIEIFGLKSGEHMIFYRKLSEELIEITRILHSKMDLKQRLKE